MASQAPAQQLVTVFGGSGFVGRHVVRALVKRGYRVRVAVRRPDLANFLQPIGTVGQIHAVQANLRYPASVAAAVKGADAVVNLVGIMQEQGRQSFAAVQANGARAIAQASAAAGIPAWSMSRRSAPPPNRPPPMRAPRPRARRRCSPPCRVLSCCARR